MFLFSRKGEAARWGCTHVGERAQQQLLAGWASIFVGGRGAERESRPAVVGQHKGVLVVVVGSWGWMLEEEPV